MELDRIATINLAARQGYMIGYFDQIHGMSSPYAEILDEFGDYYQLDLTYQDDYIMKFHYGMGRQEAARNIEDQTVAYNYYDMLHYLKEDGIPCHTFEEILKTYPDYDPRKLENVF